MLGTGVVGGIMAAALSPAADGAEAGQSGEAFDARELRAVASSIDKLTAALKAERTFDEVSAVREAQRLFLRANAKYPDFIEVGLDVWQAVYDWHVRWQQPMSVGRDAGGRYTLMFMFTTLVLRPDMSVGFLSAPYDVK